MPRDLAVSCREAFLQVCSDLEDSPVHDEFVHTFKRFDEWFHRQDEQGWGSGPRTKHEITDTVWTVLSEFLRVLENGLLETSVPRRIANYRSQYFHQPD